MTETSTKTTESTEIPNLEDINAVLEEASRQTCNMMENFMENQPAQVRQMLDPLNLTPTMLAMTQKIAADPSALLMNQLAFFQDYMKLIQNQSQKMSGSEAEPVISPAPTDKRFKAEEWSKEAPFDFIKQSYLLASKHMLDTISSIQGLDSKDARKAEFFTRQFIDAASPSNYLLTNPVALKETMETGGENLVKGFNHLLEDFEREEGMPLLKMVDHNAFEVGKNLATAEGKVVFRNRYLELIQYAPTTENVYTTPIVIFPPWINKFYILDLSEEKSFVRWAVAQGYTVFMVSWVNPDSSYAEASLDDYLQEGYLEALHVAQEITGAPSVHTIGYCVAGTMLAATLAYLHATGNEKIIKSATFFTAQVDFEESGDLSLFVDDEQLKAIDARMAEKGYLDKRSMALTFNMLRSNDLIWSYVVNNYLLGKEPMAFDLLYWNCDSTNLPRKLHLQYLKHMYKNNDLVKPGALKLKGVPIDLGTVETPCYVQAGREDHIAPAKSVYKITDHFKGPVRFVLAGSGHIAGVVNPPSANKYQYWTNDERVQSLDEFIAGANETPGSWWGDWHKWLSKRSGKKVTARQPDRGPYPPLCDAPGEYVKVKN
ncbi:class I poly(R)-hydroxyalkanoic acid synthase [Kordiimonas sediminis]|uniref:Class I poly(R)-hydroxyalkanoic acid synthase n=1 Tax=Kordiimonas sediminis TaxID=1735581 RepID=A0A919E8U4_9PROT|nr:class I poly(R)-hydroxyalkanoic acid synthase [Kordiimonas sediminis]GHF26099.1 class I poly(R)-hydroxyalkanoic acid synthase [Kordiimonas sediminis]